MMKKIVSFLLVLVLVLGLAACTVTLPEKNDVKEDAPSSGAVTDKNEEDLTEQEGQESEKEEKPKEEAPKMTIAQLEAEIAKQEVRVTSSKYLVQDEKYKSLYPDMLQAIVKNDSKYDLKNAVVAFVAWDENNLPVKIEGKYDYGDTHYVKKCNFNDINLVPGASYGNDSGFALDSDTNNIKKFKAIVVSYESFDGDTWENPLFENWVALYEGKRYSE